MNSIGNPSFLRIFFQLSKFSPYNFFDFLVILAHDFHLRSEADCGMSRLVRSVEIPAVRYY